MKKIFLCALIFSFGILCAQTPVNDSVSLGANYTKMSFYSLPDGETANVNAKDWDLQFWTSLMDASIRTNDGAGVLLYRLQNDDTTAWMSVDTSGMTRLYNSDTTWAIGAFNALSAGIFDYGWGDYCNCPTHDVNGKRIFVIKTITGNYKKIWVRILGFGDTYEIRIGNLDNSGEITVSLSKSAYPGKDFFYYAIDSAQVKDTEPQKTSWDILFRRYQSYISFPPPAQYYTVMGVLSNPAVPVAEARGVDASNNDTTGFAFDDNISVIGSDWKQFNQATSQYDFVDSLAYFVAAQDGNIYKIVFTGFGGSPTGKVFFTKTQVYQSSTGIEESNIHSLAVYPNPASGNIQALFTLQKESEVTIRVLDLSGKSHFSIQTKALSGLNSLTLNLEDLAGGFYLLSVEDGNNKLTYKLVKHN